MASYWHDPDLPFPISAVDLVDERLARIVARPDGFHWVAPDGRQEFGPFASIEQTLAEMDDTEDAIEPGETLAEAERELGLADWLDADTGSLAEAPATHIEDDH